MKITGATDGGAKDRVSTIEVLEGMAEPGAYETGGLIVATYPTS